MTATFTACAPTPVISRPLPAARPWTTTPCWARPIQAR